MLRPYLSRKLHLIFLIACLFQSPNVFSANNILLESESIVQSSVALEKMLPSCYRNSCKIWADIDLNAQMLYLYKEGVLTYTWKTSTGRFGYETPDMDTHPDGRIYEKHTSPKFPEGDYNGLGNMPFAVFIDGDYAIHGTTKGSWGKLGTTASHGCIRLHPDNGQMFNQLVRKVGIRNVWITVN